MKPNVLGSLLKEVVLIFKLFWDRRVPLWTKIIPVFTLGYVISPIDFIPDLILILGQADDLGFILLGLSTFRYLAPKSVLEEHLESIDPDHVPPTELELRQSYKLKAKNTPEQ